jgi:hypothetical protein
MLQAPLLYRHRRAVDLPTLPKLHGICFGERV